MTRKIKVIEKKSKQRDPLQTQKNVWLAGHVMTLAFGLIFAVTYVFHVCLFYKYRSWKWLFLKLNKNYSIIGGTRWYHSLLRFTPKIIYRLSLIGAIMACSVSSYQCWAGLNPQWYDMMSTENFQYMSIALLWFFSRKSIYKLCPFMIMSYLHLVNHKKEFSRAKDLSQVATQNARLLDILAFSEIVVAVALLLDTLLMKDGTAGITLVVYLGIYWLRINFSPYVQIAALKFLTKFEKKVPPKYQENWSTIKKFIYIKIEDHKKREKEIARTA